MKGQEREPKAELQLRQGESVMGMTSESLADDSQAVDQHERSDTKIARILEHFAAGGSLNRFEAERLDGPLRCVVLPALDGYQHPICNDLDQYLENVKMCLRNFCLKHREAGAAYAMGERP